MSKNQKPELLAPAGSIQSLKAAVYAGADAVYLGLDSFSARDKAKDFNLQNLQHWVEYCHVFGVKVYVAINTIIKQKELSNAIDMAFCVCNAGADAIILQDLGFALELKKEKININIHASTQMGIHNLYGAMFCEDVGFERVILSRETTIKDIVDIKQNSSIDIEYFVHGALCVSFSGNCYYSSLVSGYSANRGKCMQLCRKDYKLMLDKNIIQSGKILSAKELNFSNKIKTLVDSGVTSLKIEGRLKSPQYVGGVVSIYRHIIDNNYKKTNKDESDLQKLFCRGGFCQSHLENPTNNTIINKEWKQFSSLENQTTKIFEKKLPNNKSELLENYKKNSIKIILENKFLPTKYNFYYKRLVQIDKIEKLDAVYDFCDAIVYSPNNFILKDVENFIKSCGKSVLLNTPIITRDKDFPVLKEFAKSNTIKNIVANNIYALNLFKEKNILLGHGMNVLNNGICFQKIVSIESYDTVDNDDFIYVFGRFNLMNFVHCPKKNSGQKCEICNDNKKYYVSDEKNLRFEIKRTKIAYCYHHMVNSVPIDIIKKTFDKKQFFDFSNSELSEIKEVIKGKEIKQYSSGRYQKGVK